MIKNYSVNHKNHENGNLDSNLHVFTNETRFIERY